MNAKMKMSQDTVYVHESSPYRGLPSSHIIAHHPFWLDTPD